MSNEIYFVRPTLFPSRHKPEKEEDNSLKEIWGSSILKGEGTP
ncbi:hypothetical protein LEP1GSC195_2113 [Leptospira wolbachii serovar Codice str. CDC]|uniref:Uncharacterized protein n=1 Tax=Leptospira wolbachii serovar Codice str. CDC TaxID=1218599 RepID=R9A5C5_9LEPT|nr:hypothetical protein LEP1GSC195_2113 [Leptospira wolbachii serovar Codice str. CDC]